MSAADFPAPIELVPHRGKSLLLERIMEHDSRGTAALVTVAPASWLARADGSVPAWLAIEYMAQCVGAHERMTRPEQRDPPLGFLVSVAKLRLHCKGFHPGERLRVRTRRLRGSAGLGVASHECEIDTEPENGEPRRCATGRINLLIPNS